MTCLIDEWGVGNINGFGNDSGPGLSVDSYGEVFGESDDSDEFRLEFGGAGVEIVEVEESVSSFGVDSEVTDSERSEVLEEVGSLTGFDAVFPMAVSTMSLAPEMLGHFTGMPRAGSLEPHLPGPIRIYRRPSAVI